MRQKREMKELTYVFKTIWKFLTTDPKERTDEEWEDIFIVGEALKQTREMSERRNKRKKSRSMYRPYSMHSKRRYR